MYLGDILTHDWFDADIIYLSALLFPVELLNQIVMLFPKLKTGTRIICLKEIENITDLAFLELYATIRLKMTWGIQQVYYYKIIESATSV